MPVTCKNCLTTKDLLEAIPVTNRLGKRIRFTYGSALIDINRKSIGEGNGGHLAVEYQKAGELGKWYVGVLCQVLANNKLGRA